MKIRRASRYAFFRATYVIIAVAVVAGSFSFMIENSVEAAIGIRASSIGDNGAGAGTIVVNKPSGVVAGDVMVAAIGFRGTDFLSGPAGWSLTTNGSRGTVNQNVYYKVATGIEGSSYTWTISTGTPKMTGVIVAYTGVNNSNPIDVSNSASGLSTTAVNPPSVNTTVDHTRVVVAGSTANSNTFTANGSYTMVNQTSSSGGGSGGSKVATGVQDLIQSSAGATGTTGLTAATSADYVAGVVALRPELSTLRQQKYRWYANADSVQPGSALAAEDTGYSTSAGTILRLRLQLDVTAGEMTSGYESFKLQEATSTSGPWTDVGTTFAFYNNATPADGATISASLLTGTDVVQTYEENNPTATNISTVTSGQQTEWDFTIDTTGVSAGTYYFRMTSSDGTVLPNHLVYPTLTIASSGPTLDQQMRGGQSVVSGTKTPISW